LECVARQLLIACFVKTKRRRRFASAGALQKVIFIAAALNFLGSLTFPEANIINQTAPETEDSKPEIIVRVRGVIPRSDQPATVVDKLHVKSSLARSVVITRPAQFVRH